MRAAVHRTLDRVGLAPAAHDLRARMEYLADRDTRRRNAAFLVRGAPDGLPLPPPHLVYLVAGHFDLHTYYETGAVHARMLRDLLERNGFDVERFRSLLDFGCGCGRVLRRWQDLPATEVFGSDYNPVLVDWCRQALRFARVTRNGIAPPLAFTDGRFDFVYAISIFTHLPAELQHTWMRELERVLAPGGGLVITTKGSARLEVLDDEERRRFEAGQLVVQHTRYAGRNLCAAFHPESWVREELARSFEVLDYAPGTPGGDLSQDAYVLRRTG